MILAVCLNPAVDVTYHVEWLRPGQSHRITGVHRRAGGKAINVARVLAQGGDAVHVLAPAGGRAGNELAELLAAGAVAHTLVPVSGSTRHTVTVVEADGAATVFNEPGPQVDAAEWAAVCEAFDDLAAGAQAVVLSGSLPPGVPTDAYAQLTRRTQVPVIVDAEGAALADALAAGPALAKPNAAEAAALLGAPVDTAADALAAARALVAHGAGAAVVSRGEQGLVALLGGRAWSAQLPVPVAGNPTGAGDALTAGLARGLAGADVDPAAPLADAVALAAAAVAAPVAGEIVAEVADRLRADVVVKELT